MGVKQTGLEDLILIKPKVHRDRRGFFVETYEVDRYAELGIQDTFVQDNHSFSRYGTLRGLHFQSSPGQAKLIRVGNGKIFDVAVDIRPNSPSFGQWRGFELDSSTHHQLYIPIGFAHGFCVLSDEAHVIYKVSSKYCPETEKGFRWDDPEVGIDWPLANPVVSDRDANSPYLSELFLS